MNTNDMSIQAAKFARQLGTFTCPAEGYVYAGPDQGAVAVPGVLAYAYEDEGKVHVRAYRGHLGCEDDGKAMRLYVVGKSGDAFTNFGARDDCGIVPAEIAEKIRAFNAAQS